MFSFQARPDIYSNISKWWETDAKRYRKEMLPFSTKTLNLPINSDDEGGVCACMCEARSDQWRFPLLSSAQQQMGRGCGLVGWVTRIMNLPVVLFNKKKRENRNTYSKVGWLLSTQLTQRNQKINWLSAGVSGTCHNNLLVWKFWDKALCHNQKLIVNIKPDRRSDLFN